MTKVYLQQLTTITDGICSNLDKLDNATLKFINHFDACYQQCNMTDDCTEDSLGNGVCDTGCNKVECNYDNGDCNQLCTFECNMTLWFNDVCDISCNTSVCNYDFYQCLNIDNSTQYCYYYNQTITTDSSLSINTSLSINSNATDIDTYFDYVDNNITFDGSCQTSWVDDNYCDS